MTRDTCERAECTGRVRAYAWSAALVGAAMLVATTASSAFAHGPSSSSFAHSWTYDAATGAQASWVIPSMTDNGGDLLGGGFVATAMWAGTDSGTAAANLLGPTATWVEEGVTKGWSPAETGLYYYAANGIDYNPNTQTGYYEDINLSTDTRVTHPPDPQVNTSHTFRLQYAPGTGRYFAIIDDVGRWSWASHNPPTVDVAVGFEGTCMDCSGTKVTRTPVSTYKYLSPSGSWQNFNNGFFYTNGHPGAVLTPCSFGGNPVFVMGLNIPAPSC